MKKSIKCNGKNNKMINYHIKRFDKLEKRVKALEKKHEDLIDNLRIFMVNDEDDKEEKKVVTIGDQLDQIVEDAALDDDEKVEDH